MKRVMTNKKVKKDDSLELLIEEIIGNEDLLVEILLRVPTKSLIRFKCVSKHWLSSISDQNFCYNHSAQSPKLASAIFYYYGPTCNMLTSISLNGQQNLPNFPLFCGVHPGYIIHACNGLMLWSRLQSGGWNYSVLNLTTNKYTHLPRAPPPYSYVSLVCLSYEPAKSPHYKVVLMKPPYIVDIFFSEDNSWKRIKVTQTLVTTSYMAFWDGSIHWIQNPQTHFKFEVDKETLTELTLPSWLKIFPYKWFGECGDKLILIQYEQRIEAGFDILEMKKGATYWTMKHQPSLRPLTQLYPDNSEFHVLSVLKGSHESDVVLVLAAARKIFTYDLRLAKLDVICDFLFSEFWNSPNFQNYYRANHRSFHFIESLAPV